MMEPDTGTNKKVSAQKQLDRLFPKRCIQKVLFVASPDTDAIMFSYATTSFFNYYTQNISGLSEYCEGIEKGDFSIKRSYLLSKDDSLRREIINAILCDYRFDLQSIGLKYGIEHFLVSEKKSNLWMI